MAQASQRLPAVAGLFYPADPHSLHAQISGYLAGAMPAEVVHSPKAIIVPHAGYIYSGAVAASAYAELVLRRDVIRRVLILCPTHRVAVRGMAVPAAQSFVTPLGAVAIDRAAWLAARELPGVLVDGRPHADEHAIEVQLPFLQSTLDHFEILPIAVGQVDPNLVARLLDDDAVLPEARLTRLIRRSGGVPLFVEEQLRHLLPRLQQAPGRSWRQ